MSGNTVNKNKIFGERFVAESKRAAMRLLASSLVVAVCAAAATSPSVLEQLLKGGSGGATPTVSHANLSSILAAYPETNASARRPTDRHCDGISEILCADDPEQTLGSLSLSFAASSFVRDADANIQTIVPCDASTGSNP